MTWESHRQFCDEESGSGVGNPWKMQLVKKVISLGLMISDIVFRAKRAQPSVFSKWLRAMWGAVAMIACINQLSLLYYQGRWDYVPYYQPLLALIFVIWLQVWVRVKRACCSAVTWYNKERWTNTTASAFVNTETPEWLCEDIIDNRAKAAKLLFQSELFKIQLGKTKI